MSRSLNPNGEILELDIEIGYKHLLGLNPTDMFVSNINFKEISTKKGEQLLDITFDDSRGNNGSLLCKLDKKLDIVKFTPFKLMNRNYYECSVLDWTVPCMLGFIATEKGVNGTVKAIDDSRECYCMINGKKIINPAIDLTVEICKVPDLDEDFSVHTIKVTVKEFLNDNPSIVEELKQKNCNTLEEKINAIAKKLIQMRINEEIEFELFLDLFRQCGIMGATDQSVLKFYQILK